MGQQTDRKISTWDIQTMPERDSNPIHPILASKCSYPSLGMPDLVQNLKFQKDVQHLFTEGDWHLNVVAALYKLQWWVAEHSMGKLRVFIFRKVEQKCAERQITKQTEVGWKNTEDKQAMQDKWIKLENQSNISDTGVNPKVCDSNWCFSTQNN